MNGDGVNDLVVSAGAGGLPLVAVYNGLTLFTTHSLIGTPFDAFPNYFRGGVQIAVGDVNGDGYADIIAGSGPGMSATVNIYSGNGFGLLKSFQPFGADFKDGIFVAAGDVNGDGIPDVVVSAGAGWLPLVDVFSGKTVLGPGNPLPEYTLMPFAQSTRTGVAIALVPTDGGNPGFVEHVSILMTPAMYGGTTSHQVLQATIKAAGLPPVLTGKLFPSGNTVIGLG